MSQDQNQNRGCVFCYKTKTKIKIIQFWSCRKHKIKTRISSLSGQYQDCTFSAKPKPIPKKVGLGFSFNVRARTKPRFTM